MTMELKPGHSPDPYEISQEKLGKLPDGLSEASFEHSEATLERHARNVERFLQAVQELIRQDKTARLYQAEAKTEPVANESWSEGHPASFLVKLKADRLLGQAL